MDKRKFANRKCNYCKSEAKIWSENKWWCKMNAESGHMNTKGFCPDQEKLITKEMKKNEVS